MESQNLALAERIVEEVLIGGDTTNITDFFANPVRVYSPTSNELGVFSAVDWGNIVTGRIGSDEVITVQQMAAVDDVVFVHLFYEGTFENPVITPSGHTVTPTGEFVTIRRVLVMRFEDGKVVEQWDYFMSPLWAIDYLRYLPGE